VVQGVAQLTPRYWLWVNVVITGVWVTVLVLFWCQMSTKLQHQNLTRRSDNLKLNLKRKAAIISLGLACMTLVQNFLGTWPFLLDAGTWLPKTAQILQTANIMGVIALLVREMSQSGEVTLNRYAKAVYYLHGLGVLLQLVILGSCWLLSSRQTAYSFATVVFTTVVYCSAVVFECCCLWGRIQRELIVLGEKRRALGYEVDPQNQTSPSR